MKIRIFIVGITPLLMNKYYQNDFSELAKISAQEEAENHAYRNQKSNDLEIPFINLLSCLISAGRNFSYSNRQVTVVNNSIVPGAITFDDETISLNTSKFEIDSRQVRCRNSNLKITRHRPKIKNWQMSFTIDLDEKVLPEKTLREIFEYAGSVIGIGEFRPEKNGPFGKFKVEDWIIEKPNRKAA